MRTANETRPRSPRVAWIAGSRGEILALGPLLAEARRRSRAGTATHFLLDAGEQGMAMQQTLDFLGIVPDETASLCHPADEPAVRLRLMLERAEAFARQRKATHLIFTGAGATAAGTALACHGRETPGLWLAPADPAGQIARLRLESGFARTIAACAPCVEAWTWPGAALIPEDLPADPPESLKAAIQARPWVPEDEIAGISPWSPLAIIAVLRREWGLHAPSAAKLASAAAGWAARRSDLQWLLLSNLNASLEGPLNSMRDRPINLKQAPPLPYPLYRALMARARIVVADSPRIAAEAARLGVPVALLGDYEGGIAAERRAMLVPADLGAPSGDAAIDRLLNLPPAQAAPPVSADSFAAASAKIAAWLGA